MVIILKHKFKRFLYLSICLSILLLTLPFSSSAAVTGTFRCNFGMDGNYINELAARDAFTDLIIYYVAPFGGVGDWINANFTGAAFSLDVAYGGDFSQSQIRITNNSYYEFPFQIIVRSAGTSIGVAGTYSIPAYSNGSAGVWNFNYQDIKDRFPSANEITLWFKTDLQPIYRGPTENLSYSVIKYSTPNGIFRTDYVYAPVGTIGSYQTGALDYLLTEVNGLDPIPLIHNGFKLDTTTIPRDFIIDPDRVLEYNILYNNDGKLVQINYYDQNGNFITQESFFADVNATSFTVPTQENYIFAPMQVPLSSGVTVQSFNVYRIDFSGLRDKYYEEGFQAGYKNNITDFEKQLQKKYDEGKADGYAEGYEDGSVLTGSERNEIRKDYNAITGFFDGLYNSIFGFVDTVFNGVGIGGVTLGNVVWTLITVLIVVTLVRHMF